MTTLDLSFNCIASLEDLGPLSELRYLNHLSLRNNPLSSLSYRSGASFNFLQRLDLTGTFLQELNVFDSVPRTFPALNWLQTKDTPVSRIPSATLLTIGRLPKLVSLNHIKVSAEERQNAEIFYLDKIAKELEKASDEAEEVQVIKTHPRWEELCINYGVPKIQKSTDKATDPNTLEARTTLFTFYMSSAAQDEMLQKGKNVEEIAKLKEEDDAEDKKQQLVTPIRDHSKITETKPETDETKITKASIPPTENTNRSAVPSSGNILEKSASIPLTTSTYALQGIVGRLFSLPPPFTTTIRLFYETNEWDPVATKYGADDDDGWSVSEDDDDNNDNDREARNKKKREKGKMIRRTEELIGSTKPVGDWVTAKSARVKVVLV